MLISIGLWKQCYFFIDRFQCQRSCFPSFYLIIYGKPTYHSRISKCVANNILTCPCKLFLFPRFKIISTLFVKNYRKYALVRSLCNTFLFIGRYEFFLWKTARKSWLAKAWWEIVYSLLLYLHCIFFCNLSAGFLSLIDKDSGSNNK